MRRGAVVLAMAVIVLLSATRVHADTNGPGPASGQSAPITQNVTNNNILQLPAMPTPIDLAKQVFQDALTQVFTSLADALQHIVGGLADSGAHNFLTQTPPSLSYQNGHVADLWGSTRLAALAALGSIVAMGGLGIALGRSLGIVYPDPMVLLLRVGVAATVAVSSLQVAGWMIELNNGLAAGIGGALPTWRQDAAIIPTLSDAVARCAYLLTALVLLLQMAMRLVLVDIGIIVAPLAIVCWILPQTSGLFARWLNLFVGAVFVQFVQVLALKLGPALVSDFGGGATGVFLGIAVLVLTLRLPSLIQGGISGTGLATALLFARGTVATGAAVASGGGTAVAMGLGAATTGAAGARSAAGAYLRAARR